MKPKIILACTLILCFAVSQASSQSDFSVSTSFVEELGKNLANPVTEPSGAGSHQLRDALGSGSQAEANRVLELPKDAIVDPETSVAEDPDTIAVDDVDTRRMGHKRRYGYGYGYGYPVYGYYGYGKNYGHGYNYGNHGKKHGYYGYSGKQPYYPVAPVPSKEVTYSTWPLQDKKY